MGARSREEWREDHGGIVLKCRKKSGCLSLSPIVLRERVVFVVRLPTLGGGIEKEATMLAKFLKSPLLAQSNGFLACS